MVKMIIDDVTFSLKEEHDFTWLKGFGRVFVVFDKQDSGNIGFGVLKDGEKRFVKYAGAKTMLSHTPIGDAVSILAKQTAQYKEMAHPNLIKIISGQYIGGGYASYYEWSKGECLNSVWIGEDRATRVLNPDCAKYRFGQLPFKERLSAFGTILEFHAHVEQRGYIAVDFYEGCMMYDFSLNRMELCDIDYYEKRPYKNPIGRMWGSHRYMSPEEFVLGDTIDRKSNVFTMGAVAFDFFGGTLNRSFAKWTAGRELYDIASKATCEDRAGRYTTVVELLEVWNKCVSTVNL